MTVFYLRQIVASGLVAGLFSVAGCGGQSSESVHTNADSSTGDTFEWAAVPMLPEPVFGVSGHVETRGGIGQGIGSSRFSERRVHVWLPPAYEASPDARYPVLYMHDGQNVFDPAGSAYSGKDWAVDEVILSLTDSAAIRTPIVVAVESGPLRIVELAPEDILTHYFPPDTLAEARRQLEAGVNIPASQPLLGNAYLTFITDDLMPWVEARYRILTGPDNTFIMGSSMGGLASIYALYKRPDVFGGAAALSTRWPVVGNYMLEWLADNSPLPTGRRLYMDHGTETLDRQYAAYQRDVDALLGASGASHITSHVFKGHAHTEADWRRRVHLPLQFLLGSGLEVRHAHTVQ